MIRATLFFKFLVYLNTQQYIGSSSRAPAGASHEDSFGRLKSSHAKTEFS